MALNSVNTNVGAMIALQNLNSTNNTLNNVQNRVNTGLKVASAKDNGAIWAIAQGMRGESSALNAVKDSLMRGQSTLDVAVAAGESVSDLLIQMKEKALAAADESLDDADREKLNDDFTSLRDQIAKVIENAEFNGVNMLDGTGTIRWMRRGGGNDSDVANAVAVDSLGAVYITGRYYDSAMFGTVQLDDALRQRVQPGDAVFIFARAANGPRMPLAVKRVQVKDLPLDYTLDDSMAMDPSLSLSKFADVIVVARVSRSGGAMTQSGDLQGSSAVIHAGDSKPVQVVINEVVP